MGHSGSSCLGIRGHLTSRTGFRVCEGQWRRCKLNSERNDHSFDHPDICIDEHPTYAIQLKYEIGLNSDGVRGCRATQDFASGQIIAKMPFKLAVTMNEDVDHMAVSLFFKKC
jgi:hypothetical protein